MWRAHDTRGGAHAKTRESLVVKRNAPGGREGPPTETLGGVVRVTSYTNRAYHVGRPGVPSPTSLGNAPFRVEMYEFLCLAPTESAG
jgi:hypothetical protein